MQAFTHCPDHLNSSRYKNRPRQYVYSVLIWVSTLNHTIVNKTHSHLSVRVGRFYTHTHPRIQNSMYWRLKRLDPWRWINQSVTFLSSGLIRAMSILRFSVFQTQELLVKYSNTIMALWRRLIVFIILEVSRTGPRLMENRELQRGIEWFSSIGQKDVVSIGCEGWRGPELEDVGKEWIEMGWVLEERIG